METKKPDNFRTWVEIDTFALRHNFLQLAKLIGPHCRFMAVVKSNAYGHGLVQVAKQLANYQLPVTSNQLPVTKLWFGVDSIVEALRLREHRIKNPILVLGSTLPERMREAVKHNITLTVSNFESLSALAKLRQKPAFHIKIDSGMHRQGFLPEDMFRLIKFLKRLKLMPAGVYTHFAAAKDRLYPISTLKQFQNFKGVLGDLERAGLSNKGAMPAGKRGSASGGKNLIIHAAASGGTILLPETHLDMVRVGMALWGHWPSEEARLNIASGKFGLPRLTLRPILSWKTRIAEIKKIPAGSAVGYDLSECVRRKSAIAILPIGYWHGFDRGLSSLGYILVRGRKAKVIGRVSMDMTVCDVTNIPGVRVGDTAVIIGRQSREKVTAEEMARSLGTSPYEVLTRINPLIERIYK